LVAWFHTDTTGTPAEQSILEEMMSERNHPAAQTEMPNRRQIIIGVAAALGGLSVGSSLVRAEAEEISHSAESIHQEPLFKANRKLIYGAITDTRQFDKVARLSVAMQSGMALGSTPTDISGQVGGTFTIFGGHILGRHLELIPNERIVQAWRVVNWDPGIFSIARFELVEQGSGTKLIFDHIGFPKGQAEHLAAGWKGNYWEPLERFLT
jgi:activator of HSP90 ATPase